VKIQRNNFGLIFAIFVSDVCFIQAADVSSVQWNAMAQSQILNRAELSKLGDAFPAWKIKQAVWPDDSEINLSKTPVDPNLNASCVEWLKKFVNNKQLPVSLDKMLIPMKGWGVIRKESEQKRLCDVFIVRYKKDDKTIQIQESPYNIIVMVADDRLGKSPNANHQDLIIETAQSILNESLKPNLASRFFHANEIGKITMITWVLKGVAVIDGEGKTCISLSEAGKIGATRVEAETDGRFVRFDIVKNPGAVKNAYYDPYKERFSSSSK